MTNDLQNLGKPIYLSRRPKDNLWYDIDENIGIKTLSPFWVSTPCVEMLESKREGGRESERERERERDREGESGLCVIDGC